MSKTSPPGNIVDGDPVRDGNVTTVRFDAGHDIFIAEYYLSGEEWVRDPETGVGLTNEAFWRTSALIYGRIRMAERKSREGADE